VMTEGEGAANDSAIAGLVYQMSRLGSDISRAVQRGVTDALVLAPRTR
jgi:hypothetical protein